jgi:hypothetical protein
MQVNRKVMYGLFAIIILIAGAALWYSYTGLKHILSPQVAEHPADQQPAPSDIPAEFFQRIKNGDATAIDQFNGWVKTEGRIYPVNATSSYFLFVPHTIIEQRNGYSSGYVTQALISVTNNSVHVVDEDASPIGLAGEELLYKKGWSSSFGDLYLADLSGGSKLVVSYGDERFQVVGIHPPLTDRDVTFDSSTSTANLLGEILDERTVLNILASSSKSIVFDAPNMVTGTLFLRPGKPHFDEANQTYLSCLDGWDGLVKRLNGGTSKDATAFESCIKVLGYPFKRLQVPGSDSYYGFMGNGPYYETPPAEPEDRALCQIDGTSNGCLLYYFNKGKSDVLSGLDDEKDATTSIRLVEPIKANSDRTLLINRFPYEICLFSSYENYNFVTGTSSAKIVDYTAAGSCSDQTTLTLYPNGRQIDLGIVDRSDSVGGNEYWSLMYNGKSIGDVSYEGLSKDSAGTFFPSESDLRVYALQDDKTKFYFTVASSSYALDLSTKIPKLIKR